MNNILNILLDYVVNSTGNEQGFIGEKRMNSAGDIFYRYHAITSDLTTISTNSYATEYLSKGYFDLSHEHAMHADINIGEIHINNSAKPVPCPHHVKLNKTIFFPLHDTNNVVIGILGISGPGNSLEGFTVDIGDTFKPYVELCSYILQLAIERNNINHNKNCFLQNISTALRKPIDGILSVSKVSNSATLTPVQKKYIEVLTFYSMKLLDIVNDIQDYTKMVSGTLHLINKNMDLKACLDTVILITQQKLNGRDISLICNFEANLPETILADEIRLVQILVNLLDNACKYTNHGSIKLNVAAAPGPNNNYILNFEITDTGIGMNPEQVHNIFEGMNCRKWNNEGIGLGILIVKYLIETFGGNMTIESKTGQGTTVKFHIYAGTKLVIPTPQIKEYFHDTYALLFGTELNTGAISDLLHLYGVKCTIASTVKDYKKQKKRCSLVFIGKTTDIERMSIVKTLALDKPTIVNTVKHLGSLTDEDEYYLPVLNKDTISDLLVTIITEPPVQDDVSIQTRGRVLVAEENQESQTILVDLLKRLGYIDIDTVNDGLELYVKLTSVKCPVYEIIFVSLNISVLDGVTAIKRYRAYRTSSQPSDAKIIAITSNVISTELKEQFYTAGIHGYITKPITIRDLMRLDVLLGRQ